MDALEAIFTRRSIRKYTDKPVTDEQIKTLLEAAVSAPSAVDEQPWQFIVITDRGVLDQVPTVHPFSSMIKQAAAAIVVCGDLKREKYPGFWVQDCAAAAQNILLAARALGLGTVWLGVYPDQSRVTGLKKLLGIPDRVEPLCIIPVGYPAEEKRTPERYDESRVHYNKW